MIRCLTSSMVCIGKHSFSPPDKWGMCAHTHIQFFISILVYFPLGFLGWTVIFFVLCFEAFSENTKALAFWLDMFGFLKTSCCIFLNQWSFTTHLPLLSFTKMVLPCRQRSHPFSQPLELGIQSLACSSPYFCIFGFM